MQVCILNLKKKHMQILSFFLLSYEEFSGDINLVYLYKNAMQNLLVQKYHFLYKLLYSYYRQKEENCKQYYAIHFANNWICSFLYIVNMSHLSNF